MPEEKTRFRGSHGKELTWWRLGLIRNKERPENGIDSVQTGARERSKA
jgi:hypothetical protein